MYSFVPISEHKVAILDKSGSQTPLIRAKLAMYKKRWNESIASNVSIHIVEDDIPLGVTLITTTFNRPELEHYKDVILINSISELTHHNLRAAVIESTFVQTDELATALEWLNATGDVIACDFETAPYLTREEQTALKLKENLTHEEFLASVANGLFHPSLTLVTHLSVAETEDHSFVIIVTDELRQPILEWLANTDKKQIWHNATFDTKHTLYHTGKYASDVEDTQLMWATILNHTQKNKRLVGLKHLAKSVYRGWAVSVDMFGLEYQYEPTLIKYVSIDTQATMFLYNEAMQHEDFQLSIITPINKLLPTPFPRDFNPGRRHFYESVIKPMIEPIVDISLNGINLDLGKVATLADKLDTITDNAMTELHKEELVQKFLANTRKTARKDYINERSDKLKQPDTYITTFDYSKVDHKSYLVTAILTRYDILQTKVSFLPNGKPKYTNADIKHLIEQYPEAVELPLILTKSLDVNSNLVKQAMYTMALDKAQLNNRDYLHQIANPGKYTDLDIQFNPKSPPQKKGLFDLMQIAPIAFSKDTGEASWGREQLEELVETVQDPNKLNIIQQLFNISEVSTTRTNFVKNFEQFHINSRVYGTHKLFGTLSFRPSSGKGTDKKPSGQINMLNQPSTGSPAAKVIKECMRAPEGKVIIQIDLSSLEDRVIANLSHSKAKTDLILEGFDGHLYHSCMYFRDRFLTILDLPADTEHTAVVRAAMANAKHPEIKLLRQSSKNVTFAASYGAFPKKLAESMGCSIAEAEAIFDAYHNKLYPEITDYRENYILQTAKQYGEIHLNLGASLKTDNANADIRTLNNASIQSFSDITLIALMQQYYDIKDKGYKEDIKCINTVYDSIYYEVTENVEIIKWLNDSIVKYMIQPYLEQETIPNAAACDVGYDFTNVVEIPNNASIDEIQQTLDSLKE